MIAIKVTTLRTLAIVYSLLMLSACTSQQTFNTRAEGKPKAPVYPAIALYYKHPSTKLKRECDEFQNRSVLHHCNQYPFEIGNLHLDLAQSGAFEQVAIAQDNSDYQVMVSALVLDQETGSEIGQAALAGATLMLLPMQMEKTIRAEVVVTWQNIPIKHYDYTLPFNYSTSLLSPMLNYRKVLSGKIAERLLEDLHQENIFTGRYLMTALKASDYESDLGITDTLGDYYFDDKHIFNNPFHGSVLTFLHRQFAFDRAEVFVYPVRNVDWQHAAELTRREAETIHAELDLMRRQGGLKSLKLSDPKPLRWTLDGQQYDGTFYTSLLTDNDDQQAHTATYIFIKGDKFVRVRALFPMAEGSEAVSNPDAFARSLLQQIEPPAESLFMAKLRQKRRQSTLEMSAKE